MATIYVEKDIDVISKYQALLDASLSSNSIYIRAKETLEYLAEQGDIKDTEKAKVLSDVLVNLNNSLVTNSMNIALNWAEKEKEIELKKVTLEKEIDLQDKQILLTSKQIDKVVSEDINIQAKTIRTYGTPTTIVNGTTNKLEVSSLSDTGSVYKEMELIDSKINYTAQEATLIPYKQKEINASVHKTVADTYANYGNYTYTVTDTGVTSVSNQTPTGHETLSSLQAGIAKNQINGYAWNAWANAVTGASSLLGTAIAGGIVTFDGNGGKDDQLLDTILVAANKLKDATPVS